MPGLGLGLGLGISTMRGGGGFNIASLFADGSEGKAQIDNGDNMFSDVLGTVPAGYGDPVMFQRDTSGNGNHDTQSTLASAPIKTRWPKSGKRNELVGTATLSTQNVTVTAAERTLSFTGSGTVTLSGASTAGPLVGTGSDRVSLTFTPTAGTLTLTVSGTVNDAQLELGDTVTGIQTVTNRYDVTEAGQRDCVGLFYGGVSDPRWSVTPSIDFTGTDKMTVVAGVTKLSDAAQGMLIELGIGANSGRFDIQAPPAAATAGYSAASRGTNNSSAIVSEGYPAPTTNVLSSQADIPANSVALRVNGVQVATSGTDQGTGNYGNYPIATGARSSGALPAHGYIWGSVVVGKTLDPATLAKVETLIAANTPGVTL
ncbi:hypothetical protein [Pseudosulfitobacter pseudonitzschiae]|uniref:hypothetical protein n=1 Tax=Pseudosulfitobacter pseudonitzschiae TaxID=1402135 RepID=UPI001AF9F751|nr:hypothetical protein [Pseudosulfitobacter pseudonitzschiae]MBM1817148.1 hypothetical protein [Pseudosulfitobacter pseudonitzschiae]MBM1834151.1 hypothetical protein [Pseudosulfitobacter pseudonitzschiae]MBM1839016.1 hypothetical protein [Pseudosulfitobacter pseudonitzschiae]MBM1843866.1 hypothetical protein [Pseudosulfitobacter pseudonitzschiae]MBM1848712.1 hypothetical protein [Pseudosulfitobacter pseudonitzschiae]